MSHLRRSILAAAIVLPLALAGCSSAAPAAEKPAADAPAATSETVSVEHAMGDTEVTCTPQRVVTLGQGETDSTLALGITPVGAVSPWTEDWYSYLPKEINDAEIVGTEIEPDLEAIAALEPDLILGSKLRHEAIYAQLSEIAPTVFTETIGVSWKENVGLYAKALCLADKGEEVVADYEARAAEIGTALEKAGQADTEASIIRFMPDQVRIYLTGFPGSVIRDTGLKRPAAQTVPDWEASDQLIEISEERIPEMDGDVIFEMVSADHYAQQGTQTVDEQIERWTSTELWKGLSAVKAGKVVEVDESHWNLGGGIGAATALLADLENYFAEAE